jgi:hypothetical protein
VKPSHVCSNDIKAQWPGTAPHSASSPVERAHSQAAAADVAMCSQSSGALEDSAPSPDAFLPRVDDPAAPAPPPPPPPSESPPHPSFAEPAPKVKREPAAPKHFQSWNPPPKYWSRVGEAEPLTALFCNAIRCRLDVSAFEVLAADSAHGRSPAVPRFELMLAYASVTLFCMFWHLHLFGGVPGLRMLRIAGRASARLSRSSCSPTMRFVVAWMRLRLRCPLRTSMCRATV